VDDVTPRHSWIALAPGVSFRVTAWRRNPRRSKDRPHIALKSAGWHATPPRTPRRRRRGTPVRRIPGVASERAADPIQRSPGPESRSPHRFRAVEYSDQSRSIHPMPAFPRRDSHRAPRIARRIRDTPQKSPGPLVPTADATARSPSAPPLPSGSCLPPARCFIPAESSGAPIRAIAAGAAITASQDANRRRIRYASSMCLQFRPANRPSVRREPALGAADLPGHVQRTRRRRAGRTARSERRSTTTSPFDFPAARWRVGSCNSQRPLPQTGQFKRQRPAFPCVSTGSVQSVDRTPANDRAFSTPVFSHDFQHGARVPASFLRASGLHSQCHTCGSVAEVAALNSRRPRRRAAAGSNVPLLNPRSARRQSPPPAAEGCATRHARSKSFRLM